MSAQWKTDVGGPEFRLSREARSIYGEGVPGVCLNLEREMGRVANWRVRKVLIK